MPSCVLALAGSGGCGPYGNRPLVGHPGGFLVPEKQKGKAYSHHKALEVSPIHKVDSRFRNESLREAETAQEEAKERSSGGLPFYSGSRIGSPSLACHRSL